MTVLYTVHVKEPGGILSSNNLSSDDFFNYFSSLESKIYQCENEETENFNLSHEFDDLSYFCPELDSRITQSEILAAAKGLQAGKAYGNDDMLNEYFIETIDIIAPHLCDIFNSILDSGIFPKKWCEGIIIPLFKKGDKNCPSNYRGITLLSCFSKLFTTVINKRLNLFCDENNSRSDAQFGFRKDRSTIDAMFTLLNLVQNFLNKNKRLYVAFVDLQKCFDSIYRNALWFKLYKLGIQGKVLRVLKNMYLHVKSCVKNFNDVSNFFEHSVGLRQGEILSPILVSLFLEDLELFLQNKTDSGIIIDDIVIILLLFADDMAIIAKSPQELQENLDNLYEYCEKWGLQVNEAKTKIMVFRKRGKLKDDERWYYNGTLLDVTDDFNYLGCIFHYAGIFASHVEHVVGKSLKNLNFLLHKCRKIPVSLKTQCQLFDSFVGSTLCYGSEICGYSKSKEVERVHLKFLRRILGVKSSTCSAAVYGDLGRYPMYIARYCRLITYWCKLVSSDNIILRTVYNQAVTDSNNGFKNWVSNIKNLLNDYGFSDVFNKDIYDPLYLKQFPKVFKQRVIDCFIQDWLRTVHNSAALKDYSLIKHTFGYEPYLDILSRDMRIYFTRLRFSTLNLRIETGR